MLIVRTNTNTYLEVTPSALRLWTSRRAARPCASIAISRQTWESAWEEDLRPLDASLRSLVDQLKSPDATVVVVYHSHSAIVELQSNAATGKTALVAARLATVDSAPFNPREDPSAFVALLRDHTGEPRRTHVLCAMDSAASAQMVVDFVERSGLRVATLTPASALAISSALQVALTKGSKTPTAALWFDHNHAALAVAGGGQVHFVRLIDIGIEHLADALTTPITRREGSDEHQITLTIEESRSILERVGVPAYDMVVDEAKQLQGADLLPLIQPVLQRMVVEIKQSLRFGLPEAERAEVRLRLAGPGAAIPRLAQVIAAETQLNLVDDDAANDTSSSNTIFHVADAHALSRKLNLLPPRALAERVVRRARLGLVAGLALAGVALAADAAWSVRSTRTLNEQIHAIEPDSERVAATRRELDDANAELSLTRTALVKIAQDAPGRANWSAWLAELSRLTPESVRLTHIWGSYDNSAPVVHLEGTIAASHPNQAQNKITGFLDAIRACPLVESVELGAVQRTGEGDSVSHGFNAVVRLVVVPMTPVVGEDEP